MLASVPRRLTIAEDFCGLFDYWRQISPGKVVVGTILHHIILVIIRYAIIVRRIENIFDLITVKTFVVNLHMLEPTPKSSLQHIAHHRLVLFFLLEEEHVQITSSGAVCRLRSRFGSQLGGYDVLAPSSSSVAKHRKVCQSLGSHSVGVNRSLCSDLTVLVAFGAAR